MFKLIDSIPWVNQIFFDTAKVTTANEIATLQKGGFIYLDAAAGQGVQKIAKVPIDSDVTGADSALTTGQGANLLKVKCIYPVFISRPQDTDFNPIGSNGLITFINGTRYEGWLTADSYYQDGSTYPTITAGAPLVLSAASAVGGRPKLVAPALNAGNNLALRIVAYALSPVVNGEVKIRWVA